MLRTQTRPAGEETSDGSFFCDHSIFEQATAESLPVPDPQVEEPPWLTEARFEIEDRGRYLAFADGGEHHIVPLEEGWVRVGRSARSDVRLNDHTVSRRHALIVNSEDRGLRVLDDRSLNGVYVNGEQVEWAPLDDGDCLSIGRYNLFVVDASRVDAIA